jgi:iron complex transport system permease protein
MENKIIKNISVTVLLIILPIIIFLLSFLIGRYPISPQDVVTVILSPIIHIPNNLSPNIYTVVWDIRLPQIAAAMIVGAALSISGASFQGVFRNPLVSPDILGVSAGAAFGAALAILFGQGSVVIEVMAFITGLIAVSMTYAIGKSFDGDRTLMFVLGGIAIAALFTALTSTIKDVADPYNKLPEITYWLMGSLSNVTNQSVMMIIIPVIIGFTVLLMVRWRINILSMGNEEAQSLGLDTEKLMIIVILCCTLLTSAAVSISGIIGWVGLIIPHVARMIVGPDHKKLLPAALSLGAVFLLVIDDICRTANTVEIPLGVLTAIIGAPFFIYLLHKGYEGWS